jgi:putative membrane protein
MSLVAPIAVTLVALLHIGFLILEMFLWDTPRGRRIFGMTPEQSASSKTLAANQGLYNGFLAAGLIWGAITAVQDVQAFFLVCVIVAGIFGGLTAKRSILYMQALPGLIALLVVLFIR